MSMPPWTTNYLQKLLRHATIDNTPWKKLVTFSFTFSYNTFWEILVRVRVNMILMTCHTPLVAQQ